VKVYELQDLLRFADPNSEVDVRFSVAPLVPYAPQIWTLERYGDRRAIAVHTPSGKTCTSTGWRLHNSLNYLLGARRLTEVLVIPQ